jgi:hypothetical protein
MESRGRLIAQVFYDELEKIAKIKITKAPEAVTKRLAKKLPAGGGESMIDLPNLSPEDLSRFAGSTVAEEQALRQTYPTRLMGMVSDAPVANQESLAREQLLVDAVRNEMTRRQAALTEASMTGKNIPGITAEKNLLNELQPLVGQAGTPGFVPQNVIPTGTPTAGGVPLTAHHTAQQGWTPTQMALTGGGVVATIPAAYLGYNYIRNRGGQGYQ